MKRITKIAHERLSRIILLGDRVIDATVGNGHDTLFLAECVGTRGLVAGFDIQAEALHGAGLKCEDAGCRAIVDLYELGHESMDKVLSGWEGKTRAVMFNLGYLPGGDHTVITRPETTLRALDLACQMLMVGGVLSVMIYHGHPGGKEEMREVLSWSGGLDDRYECELFEAAHPQAPKLLWVGKVNH